MNQAFGIMDQGNFASKKELLDWIHDNLQLKVTKIEDLGTGSVFCQMLDYVFPGEVPLSNVKWFPSTEYQYLSNFKILTTAMHKKNIVKYVDVNKLVKCKVQDNLELCQWLKRFSDINAKSEQQNSEYNPIARRGNKPTPYDIEGEFSQDFKTLDSLKNSKKKIILASAKKVNNNVQQPNFLHLSNNKQQQQIQENQNVFVKQSNEEKENPDKLFRSDQIIDVIQNTETSDADKVQKLRNLLIRQEEMLKSCTSESAKRALAITMEDGENINPNKAIVGIPATADDLAKNQKSSSNIFLNNNNNNENSASNAADRKINSCVSFQQGTFNNGNNSQNENKTILGENNAAAVMNNIPEDEQM